MTKIMQKPDHAKCTKKELKMLGDFWTLAIIQSLSDGGKRFSQLEREQKINPATLTNRLRKLEHQMFIKKNKETKEKISVVYYSLTNKGRGILPVLKQIRLFSEKYL